MPERSYLIIEVAEIEKVNFNEVLETSSSTIRKSLDSKKTFIKWDGTTPSFVSNLSKTEGPFSELEIKNILNTNYWSEGEENY